MEVIGVVGLDFRLDEDGELFVSFFYFEGVGEVSEEVARFLQLGGGFDGEALRLWFLPVVFFRGESELIDAGPRRKTVEVGRPVEGFEAHEGRLELVFWNALELGEAALFELEVDAIGNAGVEVEDVRDVVDVDLVEAVDGSFEGFDE